jgi:hypothetical protein
MRCISRLKSSMYTCKTTKHVDMFEKLKGQVFTVIMVG